MMDINGSDLIVALDYLKHCQRIMNIDKNVGYREGTLNSVVNKLQSSFSQIEINIEKKPNRNIKAPELGHVEESFINRK